MYLSSNDPAVSVQANNVSHLWVGPLARLLEALVQAKKAPHVPGVHLQVRPE